jgi:hypothetical protein
MWHELGEVSGRLLASVPLLYIGVVLMKEPDAIPRFCSSFGSALQNLTRTQQWREPFHDYKPLSRSAGIVCRLFGVALAAAAVVPLVV